MVDIEPLADLPMSGDITFEPTNKYLLGKEYGVGVLPKVTKGGLFESQYFQRRSLQEIQEVVGTLPQEPVSGTLGSDEVVKVDLKKGLMEDSAAFRFEVKQGGESKLNFTFNQDLGILI